jgi:hypothetical protein
VQLSKWFGVQVLEEALLATQFILDGFENTSIHRNFRRGSAGGTDNSAGGAARDGDGDAR